MIIRKSREVTFATKEIAARFRDMTPVLGERRRKKARTEYIRTQATTSIIHTCIWASVFCRETGVWYRVNGQHTSGVVCDWVGELPEWPVLMEEYECDTIREVAELWATFDSKRSNRNAYEINECRASSLPQIRGTPAKVLRSAAAGISYAILGHTREDASDKSKLLEFNQEFVNWVAPFFTTDDGRKYFLRLPVMAAMYNTYKANEEIAKTFWWDAISARDANPDSGSRLLNKFLISTVSFNRTDARGKRKRTEPAEVKEFFDKCIHCWRAFVDGNKPMPKGRIPYDRDKPSPSAKILAK